MSRIGKKPIAIPEKVKVVIKGDKISVLGPLGEISRFFPPLGVKITTDGKFLNLAPERNSKQVLSLWGTYAAHFNNMIEGVLKGYEKKLLIEGVGYRFQVEGTNVKLSIGYSHPVIIPLPQGVKAVAEKNLMTITGIDKDAVTQFAATVRGMKKPEPYKGKGIRYDGEVIRRKAGKKLATTA